MTAPRRLNLEMLKLFARVTDAFPGLRLSGTDQGILRLPMGERMKELRRLTQELEDLPF